ncbi:MAG: NAD(P)/FAD-dependent oxidoreductase [Anaerolineaceae bacterium]|nr:NAD(P)/FAD-dependent oxidoreductase [Anaerolineaceae bacterium]
MTQPQQPQRAAEDVLVIGAGPAGIATAYALEQARITYKVVDRANVIGSTWCSLYPSLTLNTSRYYSHMPEAPFPKDYGVFPTGAQYYSYLDDFVKSHDFNIELGVTVHSVTPAGDLWRVETDRGTWLYPVVISATGIFGHPVIPQDLQNKVSGFTGEVLHAHDYRSPDQIQGKKVIVIGSGPSGVDISVEAGDVAQHTTILIRAGIVLRRRFPLGLSKHFWLMVADAILPRGWCNKLLGFLGKFDYPAAEKYGLTPPPPGQGGLTPYAGPELLDAVKAGKVQPKIAEITHCEGKTLYFNDGTTQEADILILATGYYPVLHEYLKVDLPMSDVPAEKAAGCEWEIGPNGERGWPIRDTSTHPNGRQILGYPGLYLVGTYYKGKGAMHNFNIEAAVAAEQIKTYLQQKRSLSSL